jgi:hypothetical protein
MRLAVIPGILLAFVACGGSDDSSPTEAPMNITSNAIASPKGSSNIAIPTGGRVHYFNKDATPHQIVATGTSGCSALSTDGAIPPNGDQLRPTMNSAENCSLADSANSALSAFVNVTAPPPGSSGGGGSGY